MSITLYHGSGNPNLSLQSISIIGGAERKQGNKYGGFYTVDQASYKNAAAYARMNGGEPTMYALEVRGDANIWDKPGDITRLSIADIQKWRDQGIDIVRGKDFRGQVEYAIINRDIVTGMKAEALIESLGLRDFITIVEQAHIYSEEELQAMDIDDLDRLAFGYADDDLIEIDPRDISIKWHCDLENPEHKYKLGGDTWVNSVDLSEPVEVSINEDGVMELEDGHHRRFAALKRGEKLLAKIEIKGSPVRAILKRQGMM